MSLLHSNGMRLDASWEIAWRGYVSEETIVFLSKNPKSANYVVWRRCSKDLPSVSWYNAETLHATSVRLFIATQWHTPPPFLFQKTNLVLTQRFEIIMDFRGIKSAMKCQHIFCVVYLSSYVKRHETFNRGFSLEDYD